MESDFSISRFRFLRLLLLSPILVILGVVVRIWIGSPVLFLQERPGRHARRFIIKKFRTMTNDRDANGNLLSDERRLTPFGRFLRDSSLDELPELWNIVIGEMSLVGPRPLRTQYLDRYSLKQARRHEVLPGLTGWAQVNGRNAVTWEERFEMDVWYVDHCSVWLDLNVIWQTTRKVLTREGVSPEETATMPEFFPITEAIQKQTPVD